jgi:hypothetical protein
MIFDAIDLLCARRMQDAIPKYGCLNLATNTQDFKREAVEELFDAINYIRWGIARKEIPRGDGNLMVQSLKAMITYLGECHDR